MNPQNDQALIWAQIIIVDVRPVWAGKLSNALRTAGAAGEVKVVRNTGQVLDRCALTGFTLYLIGDLGSATAGPPEDVLHHWATKQCKVVLLKPGDPALVQALDAKEIDFVSRALDTSGGQMTPETIARKVLQLEPQPALKRVDPTDRSAPLASPPIRAQPKPTQGSSPRMGKRSISIIGIGASTGGVEALQTVLRDLPSSLPPLVIVQHSRSTEGSRLVNVLNRSTEIDVVRAENGMPLMSGRAYVASEPSHHVRLVRSNLLRLQLVESPSVSGHRPSVDVMFESLSELGRQVAAVLLTGMGNDGARGLKLIRDRGGWTAAQDKGSSLVYGMPKAAADCGAVEEQLALNAVAPRLVELSQE